MQRTWAVTGADGRTYHVRTIADPGKFQGELIAAPWFYAAALDGADETYGGFGTGPYVLDVWRGNLADLVQQRPDRADLPELTPDEIAYVSSYAAAALAEDQQGFVFLRLYTEQEIDELDERIAYISSWDEDA